MSQIKKSKLHLPCLQGRMGDWVFYMTLLSFREVSTRVKLPKEIDKKYEDENLILGEWIQRKIETKRLKHIVEYIKTQEQRFFNSLILGLYDGNPTWQEIDVQSSNVFNDEIQLDYFSRTFGILTLHGDESIFAIDGQHRAYSIRKAVADKKNIANDEIAVIFVAHKTTPEGKIRTRRLFSTLNKYAKPVSQSEIIALSEDNNCAVITRHFVDNEPLFRDKILVIKNRSIRPENKTAFTNIMVFYDTIERLLTDKTVMGIKVKGYNKDKFTRLRASDEIIEEAILSIRKLFEEIIKKIPPLEKFFETGNVDRKKQSTSLLFRPIGQNVFFDTLKVGIDQSKKKKVLDYFSKDTFNLRNSIWRDIFWDEETGNILTEKSRQRFATLLILEHLGFKIKRTKKDIEIFENFKIDPKRI